MISNISDFARKNGMTKDEYINQVCKNFLALMEVKMNEQEGDAIAFKFDNFTVITKRDTQS